MVVNGVAFVRLGMSLDYHDDRATKNIFCTNEFVGYVFGSANNHKSLPQRHFSLRCLGVERNG